MYYYAYLDCCPTGGVGKRMELWPSSFSFSNSAKFIAEPRNFPSHFLCVLISLFPSESPYFLLTALCSFHLYPLFSPSLTLVPFSLSFCSCLFSSPSVSHFLFNSAAQNNINQPRGPTTYAFLIHLRRRSLLFLVLEFFLNLFGLSPHIFLSASSFLSLFHSVFLSLSILTRVLWRIQSFLFHFHLFVFELPLFLSDWMLKNCKSNKFSAWIVFKQKILRIFLKSEERLLKFFFKKN